MEGHWETACVCPRGSFLKTAGTSFHLSCHAALGKNEQNHCSLSDRTGGLLCHISKPAHSPSQTVLFMHSLFLRSSDPPEDMSHPQFLSTYSNPILPLNQLGQSLTLNHLFPPIFFSFFLHADIQNFLELIHQTFFEHHLHGAVQGRGDSSPGFKA